MSMGVKSMDLESLVGNVVQTTSNVGGDVGLALPIIVNDAPFRGLTAGPNVVLTVLGDSSVEIASIDTSQSPLTTKGDIWGYSGIDARIPIGTDTFVLTADPSEPLGLKWADPKDNIPAFQTPILQDIQYAGFDIKDISNVEFRNTTGGPSSVNGNIFQSTNSMNINTKAGYFFRLNHGGVTTYSFGEAGITMTDKNINNMGDLTFFGGMSLKNDGSGNLDINVLAAKVISLQVDFVDEYSFSATKLDMKSNSLDMGSGQILGQGVNTWIQSNSNSWVLNVPSLEAVAIQVNGVPEYDFNATQADFKNNNLLIGTGEIQFATATQRIRSASGFTEYNVDNGKGHRFQTVGNNKLTIGDTTVAILGTGGLDMSTRKISNIDETTITDFTTVTAEAGDFVWIIDSTDGLSKKSDISDFLNDNTVSNVGTGVDVFKQQTGIDFEFRTLLANTEILIAENSLDLAFSIGAIAISKITNLQTELDTKFDTIVNVGTGAGLIFRDKVGQTANLKTILGGSNITVTNNADDITISSPPDTQVTASNVGSGEGVFKQKVLSDLEFKSLLANTEILIANNVDDLAFSIGAIAISKITNLQTELDSKIETITNVGAGVGIANAKVGQNVDLQSLVAGTDISVISNGTEITIANTRTPTSASNLGAGEGVFAQKVLEDLEFKSLADTTEILVSSTATEISMLVGAIAISQVTGLQTALDSLTSGSRKLFKEKRQISVYFGNNNNIESIMFGAGDLTTIGADTPFLDADGHYNELSANVGMAGVEDGGFFCTDVVRRDLNFDIQIKFRLTQAATERLWLGFFTADPIAADNPITEHIALRLSTVASNVNFVISHADGVTQAETQVGVADLLIHTIRIVSDEANSKFQYSFDGAALTDLTTNIPAATTNLDSYNEIRSLVSGSDQGFDFWYLDGEADA
jgi:hypothetical protein